MGVAISIHDELLKQTIADHSGYVFKTVGDAVCAAFSRATDALEAAVEGQRRLRQTEWGETGELKVRMALHTGAVEEHGGDYFGLPLSRVARLLSAAHGGQLLMSQLVHDLVRDGMPEGTEERDLGEHRLKDLVRPERVYEVRWGGEWEEHSALRTLENRPHNLPAQATTLVGREREVEQICELMKREEVRLVTLTGPGGTGKTRLSLQVAADLIDGYANGVYFVALAPISNPELVDSTIAQTLGIPESGENGLREQLKVYLENKQLLLVLDNFEQVVAAAPVVSELLAASNGLKVLVTSREVLHLQGEHSYPVPTLTMPERGGREEDISTLTQYEAVRLFLDRSVAVKPEFEVTKENAPAIAEICYRLDGLPLAIELAVARIRMLSPQEMLSRMDRRLPVLGKGARDLPGRQQTLENAIGWSYELLAEEEQRLFRQLGVFIGGCDLEAAEALCGEELDVVDGVASLVEKSLVRQEETGTGSRFKMLEMIREYAVKRLEESGDADSIRQRHAEYFLRLTRETESELYGPDQMRCRNSTYFSS